MTYTGRMDHFKCDTCKRIGMAASGLPKGWCWYHVGRYGSGESGTKHACTDCRNTLAETVIQKESGQK
jgi:hypothetical protein